MQWWNSFVEWLTADSTRPVIFGAIVLILGIIVGSLLAAWISRAALRALLEQRDREVKAAAIGALIDAATEASVWNSLTPQEQVMADRAVGQADIQVRLLPLRGSAIAANWAAHQLAEFKRTSATFGYQLEPSVLEFRDRLVEWQKKPARARKIFQSDLDRWNAQSAAPEAGLSADQDVWVAARHHDQFSTPNAAPVPAPRAFGSATAATDANGAASQAPVSNAAAFPSTATQRLLDDVDALEVRPAEVDNHTVPVGTI
jgi:hypothetical protein